MGKHSDKVDHDNQLTQNCMPEMESCFCKIVQGTGRTSGVNCGHAEAKRDSKKAKWLRNGYKEKNDQIDMFHAILRSSTRFPPLGQKCPKRQEISALSKMQVYTVYIYIYWDGAAHDLQ